MFAVAVRGRCLIAHSFKGELFGTAQALHGCTYVVDAICEGPQLQPRANYLVDICAAEAALQTALKLYDRTNLDETPEFVHDNTTCERIARAVWDKVAAALPGPPALEKLRIVVRESDVAHVEYERALGPGAAPGLYTVSVRSRFMAARTWDASMQGATFVVDALFSGCDLDPAATFLFDICLADDLLSKAVAPLHQTCLDGNPAMRGVHQGNTSSNAIAEALWHTVAAGLPAAHTLSHLKLVVREHDQATAEFSRSLLEASDSVIQHTPQHTLVTRGRCMIAHSFHGPEFGPAQALHGCTYVVDARYSFGSSPQGSGSNFASHYALAEQALLTACAHYHQQNLDELDEFHGENTTCERVARALWSRVEASLPLLPRQELGALEVVVRESDVAYVAFRRQLGPPSRASAGAAVMIDVDSLEALATASKRSEDGETSTPTGIVHRRPLGTLTSAIPHQCVAFSRRSDVEEVRAAMELLGLHSVAMPLALISADTAPNAIGSELLKQAVLSSKDGGEACLITADSHLLSAAIASHSVRPVPAVGADFAADRALLSALGCCTPRRDDAASRVGYLTAKRPIDEAAYNQSVLRALHEALSTSCRQKAAQSLSAAQPELRVFDIGAGTLSMLPLVHTAASSSGFVRMHYSAFDSDSSLLEAAVNDLLASGKYERREGASGGRGTSAPAHSLYRKEGNMTSTIHLYCGDILTLEPIVGTEGGHAPCDLLVGSGFADLLPPPQLATLLPRLCPGGLAYLPITFSGVTRLQPSCNGIGHVPSDSRVADAYHSHLILNEGQYIEPRELVEAVGALGGSVVHSGPSHWVIPAAEPMHLWMVDFLAAGAARALWAEGFDPAAWRERVLQRRPTVVAENVDLLLRLPVPAMNVPLARAPTPRTPGSPGTYAALEFAAPRQVAVRATAMPSSLAPGDVAICSVVSMISSGTELLIYRGQFDDSDEPLDATIKGLSDEKLSYPMAYGYSLVGTIAAVGSGVPSTRVGQLVFAFAPHAEYAFSDAAAVHVVPDGICALDAAFLPAAETAISIVHDAHPRVSEVVHVFGAGVIGLLVVATLRSCGVTVVAIEPDAGRRATALKVGAHSVYHPGQAPRKAADVSIECCGNPAALQGALDGTVDCGRVVIASWYGKKPVSLALGTRFHRSHIELVASQVSAITGPHASRWSKARRFDAAWDLIRRVRPSAALPLLSLPLNEAAKAYELLDQQGGGGAAVILFEYDDGAAVAEEQRKREARTHLRAKF